MKDTHHCYRRFGGANGVRDAAGLESALARPFQTFAGANLNTTIFEKAAAVGESIFINHPFIVGNKRTSLLLMEALLKYAGFKISTNGDELYNFVINISTGTISFDQIVTCLKKNAIENM